MPALAIPPLPPPATAAAKPCVAAVAADLVAASPAFQALAKKNAHLKLMDEGDAGRVFGLRVYVESPAGEVLTLDRFRVDFGDRKLLRYDPIAGEYAPVAGAAPLFAPLRCR